MKPDQIKDFIEKVAGLEEQEVLALVAGRLRDGDDPLAIIDDCQQGMMEVGLRYENGEYFISSLIVAGELFRQAVELVYPLIEKKIKGRESGAVLLGTVHGDIHDLGKNLVKMMLTCNGFKVHDLGVDVPPEEFVSKAATLHPDIIGLSGLLTTAFDSMQETVGLIKGSDDPAVASTPVIIGGSLLKADTCKYIGADFWTNSAIAGVGICKRIIAERRR